MRTIFSLLPLLLGIAPQSSSSSSSASFTSWEKVSNVKFRSCPSSFNTANNMIRLKLEESLNKKHHYEEEIYELMKECPNTAIYAPLSEVYDCVSSFELVPTQNAIQHLQSTIDVIRDHYIFKDIAIDPIAVRKKENDEVGMTTKSISTTASTAPFGYPIYNGTDQGQFDIISGLEELLDDIQSKDSATLDMFLEMNAMASKLFDAHLKINDNISNGGMLSNQTFILFSEEVLSKRVQSTQLRTIFPSKDKEFILMEDYYYFKDNKKSSKQIRTIDGKKPINFFIELATQPTGIGVFKSIGARTEAMIQYFTGGSIKDRGYMLQLKLSEEYPSPSKFFKDEYDITYDDGSSSKWRMYQLIPQPVSCDLTKSDIERLLLSPPGKMYERLESMKRAVTSSERVVLLEKNQKRENDEDDDDSDESQILQSTERTATTHSTSDDELKFTMQMSAVGYKVFSDYAVLKIDSFSEPTDADLLNAWIKLSRECHKKKVTKLIIDLVDNAGGYVSNAYFLAQLLYPDATWEELSNPYDRLYTKSIEDHVNDIETIIDGYVVYLQQQKRKDPKSNMDNDENQHLVTEIFNTTDNDSASLLWKDKFDSMLNLLQAIMDILSGDNFDQLPTTSLYLRGSILSAIESTKSARDWILKRKQTFDEGQFHALWHILATVATKVLQYPFEDMSFKEYFGIDANSLTGLTDRIEHFRGGVVGNYTEAFHLIDPNKVVTDRLYQDKYLKYPNQFDQYILLGSGNQCGSTTDTFRHTVQSYAHTRNTNSNDDTTKVPSVRTVSFGGTGKQQDAAVTQFSAGAAGQAGNVEELYLIALVLRVLNVFLLSDNNNNTTTASEAAFDTFYTNLPDACYYCNKPFVMPIYEIYSKLTIDTTMSTPLEYVNQLPDYYIAQWPSKTSFGNNQHLPLIYDRTGAFFD